jgi:hypothetical protein
MTRLFLLAALAVLVPALDKAMSQAIHDQLHAGEYHERLATD